MRSAINLKTLLVAVILLFSSCYAFAHLSWSCLSDSVITYTLDNGAIVPYTKTITLYDFDGNKVEIIEQGFDKQTSLWTNTTKVWNSYVNNGNTYYLTKTVDLEWKNNTWDSTNQTINNYTPSFNLASTYISSWNGTGWNPVRNTTYVFPDDSLQHEYIIQDWINNNWQNTIRVYKTYDTSGNVLLDESYYWSLSQSSWIGSAKKIFQYVNGLLSNSILSLWSQNNWVAEVQETYQYDGNSNLLMREVSRNINSNWVNEIKYTFTYQANLETSRFKFLYDTLNGVWLDDFKYLSTYDGNLNLIQTEYFKKEDTVWVGQSKSTYVYDTINQEIEHTTFAWDTLSLAWVNHTYKTTTRSGFRTTLHYFNWDTVTTQWVNAQKEVIIHDNDTNLRSTASYNWLSSFWKPVSKDSFNYDDLGNEILEMSFLWNDVFQVWEMYNKLETVIHTFELNPNTQTEACIEDSLIVITANNSIFSNIWYNGQNEMSNETDYTLIVKQSGDYTGIIADRFCKYKADTIVTRIGTTPDQPIITQVNDSLTTQLNKKLHWYRENQYLDYAYAIKIDSIGDYYAKNIDSTSGCFSFSDPISILSEVSEKVSNQELIIRPNIVTDKAWIMIPAHTQQDNLKIFNANGRLVETISIRRSSKHILNVSDYEKGLYIVQTGHLRAKFIVY